MVRDARKTTAKRARVRFEICARSPKFSHKCAAPWPRVWRCESALRVHFARFWRGFGARRAQNDRKTCARAPRLRCKICARSAKVLRECAAALPCVWRCESAVLACKSRDFGVILVRDARQTTAKRFSGPCGSLFIRSGRLRITEQSWFVCSSWSSLFAKFVRVQVHCRCRIWGLSHSR